MKCSKCHNPVDSPCIFCPECYAKEMRGYDSFVKGKNYHVNTPRKGVDIECGALIEIVTCGTQEAAILNLDGIAPNR